MTARIFIDVSDLLEYAAGNRNLSGIQRVQAELIEQAMREPARILCVMTQAWNADIRALPRAPLAALLALLKRGEGGGEAAHALLGELHRDAPAVQPVHGGAFLVAGAFWMGSGNTPLHAMLRRHGMGLHVFIHDLIPITHPDVCVPDLVREFTAVLGEVLLNTDGFIANSEHTAGTIRDLIARRGLAPRRVVATPLAHGIGPRAPEWTPRIAALREQPFVLSVGTIEARKNHALLLRAWTLLGEAAPLLVLVGKRGWKTDDFDAAMQGAPPDRILILTDISDAELEALYGACLFTAFPSRTEGWGLPVGESLARGRLCVASDRGSLPEVGGEFALYIDPDDPAAAAALFRRLVEEPDWRASLEARIRDGFTPRAWPEVAESIIAALEAAPAPPPAEPTCAPLPAALHWQPAPLTGEHAIPPAHDVLRHPLRVALSEGWEKPAPGGARILGSRSHLHLHAQAAGLLRITIAASAFARLRVEGRSLLLWPGAVRRVTLPLRAGDNRLVLLVRGRGRRPVLRALDWG